MKQTKLKLAIVATALAASNAASATTEIQSSTSTYPEIRRATREELQPHFGVLGGVTNPEGTYHTAAGFGLDIGVQPVIPFSIGAEYNHYGNDQYEKNVALAKVAYNFGGANSFLRHTFVGAAAGWMWRSFGTTLLSAPLVGFDIPVALGDGTLSKMTLGAVARYEILEGSGPDGLTVNGAMKYWF